MKKVLGLPLKFDEIKIWVYYWA